MLLIYYMLIGLLASLIVVGWQGYKDSPWENFVLKKFIRSIIVGIVIGSLFFLLETYGIFVVNNLGLLVLVILSLERIVGETYKGFLRKSSHPEYERIFLKLKIHFKSYVLRALTGILGAIILCVLMLILLTKLIGVIIISINNIILSGAIVGLIGGTISAIGGAIKDSQFEGFKWKKFIRSPIVGIIGGIILIHFSTTPLILLLSVTGFERVAVELFKTFIKKQIRGIFEGKEPKYKIWLKKRWIFEFLFFIGILSFIILLILTWVS